MRFHGLLEESVSSSAKAKVLSLFLAHPVKAFSGREVARLCGLSAMGAWRAVHYFEQQSLVNRSRVGASNVLTLNAAHFLVRSLQPLVRLDEAALEHLKKLVLDALPLGAVGAVYLFGSVARGQERPSSDVDVLIVVLAAADKRRVLDASNDAALKVAEAFGNHLSALVFTRAEFKRDLNLFREVRKDGMVMYEKGVSLD